MIILRIFRTLPTVGLGLLTLWVGNALMPAQNTPNPENVVLDFRRMDGKGERLTVDGWYAAAKFFLKPLHRPRQYPFGVIMGEAFEYTQVRGNKAEVNIRQTLLGQVDSSGRFTSVVAPQLMINPGGKGWERGVPNLHGPFLALHTYGVVFTDTHWEFGPKGQDPREVKGPPEWRLEYFEVQPWVTKDVAISYLTRLREESNSDSKRRTLERSIDLIRRAK